MLYGSAVRWGAWGQQKEKKWFRSVSLTCICLPATPQLYIQTTSRLTVRCEPPRLTQITPQPLSQWACKSTLITSVEAQRNCFKWSVYDLSWIHLWAHQVFPHCEKSSLSAWNTCRIMIRKENPDVWENCAKWWWRWNIEGKYLQTLQVLMYLNALPHSGCRMKLESCNSLNVSVLCLRITATISSFLTPLLIFLSLIFHSLLDNCQSAVLKFKIFAFIFNNLVCSVCVCVLLPPFVPRQKQTF